MSAQMRPVTFDNRQGCRLMGILHEPLPAARPERAIILLSPGVKTRVAPHRLYNKMAARFVELGYPVLRFDFFGLGDAEGQARETYLADLYRAIQLGRYVDDAIAAMDWMQREYGTSQFILGGLCGGAITGLMAGQQDQRVKGLLSLGIPVIVDGAGVDASRFMTDAQLQSTGSGYLRRLRDPRAWRSWVRFLTFQSHYSLILKSVVRALRGERTTKAASGTPGQGNANPLFPPAFLAMVSSSRPHLLIFSGGDRLYWEFEEKFLRPYHHQISPYSAWFDVHLINEANHILSFTEWQQEMLEVSCAWLTRHDPSRAVAGTPEAVGRADH